MKGNCGLRTQTGGKGAAEEEEMVLTAHESGRGTWPRPGRTTMKTTMSTAKRHRKLGRCQAWAVQRVTKPILPQADGNKRDGRPRRVSSPYKTCRGPSAVRVHQEPVVPNCSGCGHGASETHHRLFATWHDDCGASSGRGWRLTCCATSDGSNKPPDSPPPALWDEESGVSSLGAAGEQHME